MLRISYIVEIRLHVADRQRYENYEKAINHIIKKDRIATIPSNLDIHHRIAAFQTIQTS